MLLISRLPLALGQDRVQRWGQDEPTGRTGEVFLPGLDRQGERGQEVGRSPSACIHRGLSAGTEGVLPWEDAALRTKAMTGWRARSGVRKHGQEAWSSPLDQGLRG